MPSKSKSQQRFFGLVRAVQQGKKEAPTKEVADAANSMRESAVREFAKTKHKGLPMKKEQYVKMSYLHKARLITNALLLKQSGKLPGGEAPGGDSGTGTGDSPSPGDTNPASGSTTTRGAHGAKATVSGVMSRIRNFTPGVSKNKRRDAQGTE